MRVNRRTRRNAMKDSLPPFGGEASSRAMSPDEYGSALALRQRRRLRKKALFDGPSVIRHVMQPGAGMP